MENKTVLGIDENYEAVLCYVLGWLTGIVFLLLEKENKFVRFHAMQSLVVFLALSVLSLAIGWIPVIGLILFIAGLVLWIILMFKAFQGEKYEIPVAGEFAETEKQIFKNSG